MSIPERGITHFFIDDLCHTLPFAFSRVLSIAVTEQLTPNPSLTNRYPIVAILSFISVVEMIFSLLSNVRLLGTVTRPQTNTNLWLYFSVYYKKSM